MGFESSLNDVRLQTYGVAPSPLYTSRPAALVVYDLPVGGRRQFCWRRTQAPSILVCRELDEEVVHLDRELRELHGRLRSLEEDGTRLATRLRPSVGGAWTRALACSDKGRIAPWMGRRLQLIPVLLAAVRPWPRAMDHRLAMVIGFPVVRRLASTSRHRGGRCE